MGLVGISAVEVAVSSTWLQASMMNQNRAFAASSVDGNHLLHQPSKICNRTSKIQSSSLFTSINGARTIYPGEKFAYEPALLVSRRTLFRAYFKGHKKKINVNSVEGDTPLHSVVRNGGSVIDISSHLEKNINFISSKNALGDTALHVAARFGHFKAVVALCDTLKQYNMNVIIGEPNNDGETALHLALVNRHEDVTLHLATAYPKSVNDPVPSGSIPMVKLAEKMGYPSAVVKKLAYLGNKEY